MSAFGSGRPPPHIVRAASTVSTPAFIYDVDSIVRNAKSVVSVLGPLAPVMLAVAIKANRCIEALQPLARLGLAASVASLEELATAQEAGFERFYATNPGFSSEALVTLIDAHAAVSLSSLSQVARFRRHCPGRPIGLRVRLEPPEPLLSEGVRGGRSRFGIDVRDVETLGSDPACVVDHLHAHLGDLQEIRQLEFALESLLAIAESVPTVQSINAGGGWYPLFDDLDRLRLFVAEFAPTIDAWRTRLARRIEVRFEPGAQLLLEFGYLVATVLAVDEHRGLDAVLVTLDASAWNLMPWTVPRVQPLVDRGTPTRARIVANTCFEEDILVADVMMSRPKLGDRVLLAGVGAYTATNARAIHGTQRPAEVAVRS